MSVTTVSVAEKASVLDRLNQAREDARVNGTESSEYFMDKCGAEAGDYLEPADIDKPIEPHKSRTVPGAP